MKPRAYTAREYDPSVLQSKISRLTRKDALGKLKMITYVQSVIYSCEVQRDVIIMMRGILKAGISYLYLL